MNDVFTQGLRRTIYVLAGLLILGLFIYATRAILLPFVAGFAVAYLLDPVADKFEDWHFPRWLATTCVLAIFFVFALAILIAAFPVLQAQLAGFISNFPGYLETLKPMVDDLIQRFGNIFGTTIETSTESLLEEAAQNIMSGAGTILASAITQGAALFNLVTLFVISPVVAFFLLRDWDRIVETIDGWLPAKQGPAIRQVMRDIDRALAGFVRGQTVVVLIMAAIYSTGWGIVGLNYALVVDILAGLGSYVPFVGALFAAVIAMLLAVGQFGMDFIMLAQVFAVFVVAQLLEGTVFTPRLIGGHVGLHPVWVLFAIFAGGEVMGFVGILIALPAAAAIGVLVRFGIVRYLESDLHKNAPKKSTAADKGAGDRA